MPRQNPKDEAKIDVEVMVKERPMKTVDIEMEWALAPGPSGKATLAHPVPGAGLTLVTLSLCIIAESCICRQSRCVPI